MNGIITCDLVLACLYHERNKNAAEYLVKTYPDLVKRNDRPDGTPEVKLTLAPRIDNKE